MAEEEEIDCKAIYEKEKALYEEAKRLRDQAEQAIRKTTLKEYLQACQEYVLLNVKLFTDGYLTTTVPATKPTKKHCPHLIRPWHDFVETQQMINECIDRIIPHDARLFESVTFLEGIGHRIQGRPVYREADIFRVQNITIIDPIHIILNKMKGLQPERQSIVLCEGIRFQPTADNLCSIDCAETAQDRKPLTDQICVLRGDQEESIAYIIEYKAPRRLHTIHLDKGLRPMNIFDDVVNKPTIPTMEPEKSQHYAELLTAAALTQTYHYMLEAGLEYGCLANGDAFVFLKIDWSEPTVLLYHLAQPSREVEVDGDAIYSNAVCQLLAFTVLALQSQQHGNDERVAATQRCETWEVDFHYMVDQIAAAEGPTTPSGRKHRQVPSSPEWLPTPIQKKQRRPRQQPEAGADRVLRSHSRRDDPGSGSGGGMSGSGAGPSGSGSGSGGGGDNTEQHGRSGTVSGSEIAPSSARDTLQCQLRPYCTPLCLMSLVHGRALDHKCPNATLHRGEQQKRAGKKAGSLQKHPVSYIQWMGLLREQLSKSLEKGVVVLRKQGACGALFQITLLQYGYTFVAKGGMEGAMPKLKHEEAVYQRLQPLQGRYIPIYIGSVDLRPLSQVFFYSIGVRLVYFLLMSYGGTRFLTRPDAVAEGRLVATLKSVVNEMHSLGVVHGDIRLPNVLLSPTGHLTVIDFDRAQLLPLIDHGDLSAVSPKERKRHFEQEDDDAAAQVKKTVMARLGRREDRSNVESIFTMDCGRILGWSRQ